MNNKERMLLAMRGQMPDVIPFAPRLDLWFTANQAAGCIQGLQAQTGGKAGQNSSGQRPVCCMKLKRSLFDGRLKRKA